MNTFIKGPESDQEAQALKDAIHDLSSQAHGHLQEARKLYNDGVLSKHMINIMYPSIGASLYLDCLSNNDFDPFKTTIAMSAPYTNLRLNVHFLYSKLTKRF